MFQFDCPAGWSGRGPLYDYVFCEDPVYNWVILDTYVEPGVTTYILNVTSQMWYDGKMKKQLPDLPGSFIMLNSPRRTCVCTSLLETLHSWPLWWHFVSVSIPDEIVYEDKAAIYISSGSNDDRCVYDVISVFSDVIAWFDLQRS